MSCRTCHQDLYLHGDSLTVSTFELWLHSYCRLLHDCHHFFHFALQNFTTSSRILQLSWSFLTCKNSSKLIDYCW